MNIDGEEYEIYPEVWEEFVEWWGDKAYRHAGFVQGFQARVIESHGEHNA